MTNLLPLSPTQRGGLLRGVLCAPPGKRLVVCDFAGIEARVLAWLAGDEAQLQLFRDGGDPYKRVAAEAIFFCTVEEVTKDQRQIGKVAELALGYQMGWKKFEANVGRDVLEAAGTSAYQIVNAWRELRGPVVELWAELERQWAQAYGYFEDFEDGTRRMILPSGRPIVYRDATYEGYIGRGGRLVRGYGGLWTENLVQSVSRELLAAAMVKTEDAGLTMVLTAHDEIVCEEPEANAEEALHTLERIMSEAEAPAWAQGCPIGCEGYIAERYRK